jgi:formylglycine-generating enzyme required for sulfatase activity
MDRARVFVIVVVLSALLIWAPRVAAQSVYRLPQVADGGGAVRTTFVFVNHGREDAEVALYMTMGEGVELDFRIPGLPDGMPKLLELPAGQTRFLSSEGAGALRVGAARIESTAPIGVFAIFSLLGPGGHATVEAGVGDSTPREAFTIPVDTTSGFDTGVALFNDNPEPAVVEFAFHGEDGIERQGGRISELAAGGQQAKYVSELFPDLGARRGQMTVVSNRPLAALSLRQGEAGTPLTTLPVLGGAFHAAGDLYGVDPIVGNLRFVPAGAFTQGSPAGEPCRHAGEAQFTHTLTRSLAVMETEVSRGMWNDLGRAQPTLPLEPTILDWGDIFGPNYGTPFRGVSLSHPVRRMSWYEGVLFANLLSAERGLDPTYYVDQALTQPLTASNYQTDDVFADWGANGYRLPTEAEREYFTRAGSTGPFSVNEPNYSAATCLNCVPGTLPQLESVAWFCGNQHDPTLDERAKPVGLKAPNAWGLRDVHGSHFEWTWDWFGEYPGGHQTDYSGPAEGTHRVRRGGFRTAPARDARSASRASGLPSQRYGPNTGFRLVRTVH